MTPSNSLFLNASIAQYGSLWLSMDSHYWIFVAHFGSIWLPMASLWFPFICYGFLWLPISDWSFLLPTASYGSLRIPIPIRLPFYRFLFPYGYLWFPLAPYEFLWLHITRYDSQCFPMALYESRIHMAPYGSLWLPTTLYASIWICQTAPSVGRN